MTDIDKIKQELDYYDNLYYNQDTPELSDIEYDILKQKYLQLSGETEYNYVPGEAQFSKYKHTTPIKSLAKVNSQEDLRKELIRFAPGVIEYKLDGLTLVDYPDGNIVTRGDSLIGENVTMTAKQIGFPNKPSMPVRMEAFITKKVFEQLNKEREEDGLEPFKNARNAVAGMLRNKDIKKVKGITYFAYNIIGSDKTEQEQLMLLTKWGFKTVDYFYYTKDTIDEAIEFINNISRDELDFEIDGMVIKSDIPNALKIFGETEHHPNSMCSYKYPNQGKWTRLLGVTWQVGRTGKISPVAELKPVDLNGSTISRATLHNINYIKALGLKINSDVLLCKANDVIPAITGCRDNDLDKQDIIQPAICPNCGTRLRQDNMQLYCDNNSCSSKLLFRTKHMVSRNCLNIDGLSEQSILKMIEAGYMKEPWDIFDITEQQILSLDGFAKKSAKNIYENIQNAKTTEFNRFIYSAGIPLVGKKVSKDIAKRYNSYENLKKLYMSGRTALIELNSIDGIGSEILNSFAEKFYLLDILNRYVTPIPMVDNSNNNVNSDNKLTGKIFVVTGSFNSYKPRTKLEELIVSFGGTVTGSVSKNTSYLINNDFASTSGKNKKAHELNIPIITEEQFEQMIR